MTTSNTYGRQVVVPLTNKSGGGVIAGDVVVVDSTTNDAFTTTTSASTVLYIGVAQETIANNAVGRVLLAGYAPLVNVNASVTRLHYGATFTVAKQATDAGASRGAGTFCIFLSSGTTPDAIVYPVDLAGAALTNPMGAVGDMIQGTTAGAPAALNAGAAGKHLTAHGAATPLTWEGASGAIVYNSTTQSINNAAATFDTEDLDTDGYHESVTNPTRITIPSGFGGKFMLKATLYSGSASAFQAYFRIGGSTLVRGSYVAQAFAVHINADVVLADGNYVEAFSPDNMGTTGSASDASKMNTFSIMRIGS